MNVDEILKALNDQGVDYILIGGMNFLLRHLPELTFDVDIWVRDDQVNLACLNRALLALDAEWGRTERDWKRIPNDERWLQQQAVFCLTTRAGALDVFRDLRGLEGRYSESKSRSISSKTASGVTYSALSDEDMLSCQEALPQNERKLRRMEVLREAIRAKKQ